MNLIRCIAGMMVLAALNAAPPVHAADAGRPDEAFAGCSTVIAAAPKIAASRQRIADAATRVDTLTHREFASFSVDELAGSLRDDEIDQCWFRLDGVWREDVPISLDTDFIPSGWSSARPELVHLANGTYTTPLHIVVLPSSAPERVLQVTLAEGNADPVRYVSEDGMTLRELLENRGRTKVYAAPVRALAPGLAPSLTIDVTRTGYLRLRMAGASFYRPAPGTVS